MTAVQDRLYIFGGQDPETGICFNDVVVFHPVRATRAVGLVELLQCSVLKAIASSSGSPTNDVWIFDTELGEWSRPTVKGQAPAAREMHSAVFVEGHGLVIYGGRSNGSSAVLSDVVVLDIGILPSTPTLV
eukprot:618043-Prorocentrum_minimum.AAC.8